MKPQIPFCFFCKLVYFKSYIYSLQQHEERYIVEIHVAQNLDVLYQAPTKK